MQPFSLFFFVIRCGGGISGRVRALNLTVPLGSGRVGSDDLGYGPGSGLSFEPVQTSSLDTELCEQSASFAMTFYVLPSLCKVSMVVFWTTVKSAVFPMIV